MHINTLLIILNTLTYNTYLIYDLYMNDEYTILLCKYSFVSFTLFSFIILNQF